MVKPDALPEPEILPLDELSFYASLRQAIREGQSAAGSTRSAVIEPFPVSVEQEGSHLIRRDQWADRSRRSWIILGAFVCAVGRLRSRPRGPEGEGAYEARLRDLESATSPSRRANEEA